VAVSKLLYHEAGLKGLSGISNDMRDLLANKDPRAEFEINHFVYRCALNIGALTAALGGLDALVFTAGIGENAAELPARIIRRMAWSGTELGPGSQQNRLAADLDASQSDRSLRRSDARGTDDRRPNPEIDDHHSLS
jgi:acetate kinase